MKLCWTDVTDIAISLDEKYPDVDVANIRFTDLFNYIITLEDFDDDHKKCNEKILEAIQMKWLEEVEDR
jgi:FeS assembly protein IscX